MELWCVQCTLMCMLCKEMWNILSYVVIPALSQVKSEPGISAMQWLGNEQIQVWEALMMSPVCLYIFSPVCMMSKPLFADIWLQIKVKCLRSSYDVTCLSEHLQCVWCHQSVWTSFLHSPWMYPVLLHFSAQSFAMKLSPSSFRKC